MKKFIINNVKYLTILIIFLLMIFVLSLNITTYLNASTEISKFEIRNKLMMEAFNEIGACRAEKTAEIWASGVISRNAAIQYSVMTQKLKDVYAKQLENSFPNWVTGVSSPWIENYQIIQSENPEINVFMYQLRFFLKTSAGPAGNYNAVITVNKEGDYWRITDILTDEELYDYTGYTPLN